MTAFDYAVLAIAVFSLLIGLWRGVLSEMLALVAWVAAFIAARAAATQVGATLQPWIADPALQYVAGFAVVFLGILMAFAVLRLALKTLLRIVGLGLVDRVLGGVFGLVRAAAIVVALVLAGGLTAAPQQDWWRQATLSPPLETAVIALKPWLPQAVAKRIRYR